MRKANYQNGKVYIIISKIDRTMTYIGSTCESLSKRLCNHRAASKLAKNKNFRIYQYFLEHGWANAEISLLETCPCKNKMELLMKEREYKDKLNPSLNMINPYTTDDEKKKQKKKREELHKEKIKQQHKQWEEQHKEKRKEQNKKWHEQHKTKTECPNCKRTLLIRNLEKHMETKTCQEQYFRTKYAFDDCSNESYNLKYIE